MAEGSTGESLFELYRYTPNLVAAIIFVILFVLTTGYHLLQLIRNKTWYFIPFVIGGIFEIIGYIGRALAHKNTESIPLYSLQTILILLGPALFAASIYMVLGRLVRTLHAEQLSVIPVKWMTKIFVVGDVFGFLGQAIGGGIMASGGANELKTGEHITVAGLCVQILFFSVFVIVAITFHRRFARSEGSRGPQTVSSMGTTQRTWEALLYALYATSILIWIRSVFRVIEFGMGNDGFLLRNEVFLYVFDATLMFLAMAFLNIVHPCDFVESRPTTVHGSLPLAVAHYKREPTGGSSSPSEMV